MFVPNLFEVSILRQNQNTNEDKKTNFDLKVLIS